MTDDDPFRAFPTDIETAVIECWLCGVDLSIDELEEKKTGEKTAGDLNEPLQRLVCPNCGGADLVTFPD